MVCGAYHVYREVIEGYYNEKKKKNANVENEDKNEMIVFH